MTTSYNVCPVTGLGYQIIDDNAGAACFYGARHPVAADPVALFHKIEKNGQRLTKEMIAAGILLQLEIEDLIVEKDKEASRFCRGQANAMLASFNYAELIKLYWSARNTLANLNKEPLKVNLVTSCEAGRYTLYANLISVAAQDVGAADMKEYIRSKALPHKLSLRGRASKKINVAAAKERTKAKSKMDIVSCLQRCKKDMAVLCEDLQEQGYGTIPLASVKKAGKYLYLEGKGSMIQGMNPAIKDRIVEIMDHIYKLAIHHALIDMDSIQAKSYELVRQHLSENLKAVVLDVEF